MIRILLLCTTVSLAFPALGYEVGLIAATGSTGNVINKGTIKVRYNDSSPWGLVCDDDFDILDGDVVCKVLGFVQAKHVFIESSLGIVPNMSYVLDDVECNGTESTLDDCASAPFGSHNCDESEQTGVRCTMCPDNPCNGRGTCYDTSSGTAACSCNPAYTSSNCETEINFCLPNPCSNSGTCLPRLGDFTCTCTAAWTGKACEKDVNVNRRLDIVASYNILCSKLVNETTQRLLQNVINYRYLDIEPFLYGIARRSAIANATSLCANDILAVTWPMSRIYPADVTTAPPDVVQRMNYRFSSQVALTCNALELQIFSSAPIMLKPVVNSKGWVADTVLKPFCKNNLLYNSVTDSCIANGG